MGGFLAASAASALAGVLPLGLRNALAATPTGTSLSAVKHVVVCMQENRSFDHYFGTLQGVRGYGDRSTLLLQNGNAVFKQSGVPGTYLPFHLDTAKTSAQCVVDLDHSWITQHLAVNGGRMDQWINAKTPLTVGGFQRIDCPWQYDVAAGATAQDYFSAQLFGAGKYDLSLYGPNGVRRRFVGNIDTAGAKAEASASYDLGTAGHAKLVLALVNTSSAAVGFTVRANAYRGDGPWLYSVAPAATVTASWDVQSGAQGWYDFTATVNSDALFSRTFAGHVELGQASITG